MLNQNYLGAMMGGSPSRMSRTMRSPNVVGNPKSGYGNRTPEMGHSFDQPSGPDAFNRNEFAPMPMPQQADMPQWPQLGLGQDATATVSSSPRTQQIYSPAQTAAATAQAVSQANQMGSADVAMKQFERPGMSRGAGTMAAALPQIAAAQAAAARARTEIPMQHRLANTKFAGMQQAAQGQEALDLYSLLRASQNQGDQYRQRLLGPLLGIALG